MSCDSEDPSFGQARSRCDQVLFFYPRLPVQIACPVCFWTSTRLSGLHKICNLSFLKSQIHFAAQIITKSWTISWGHWLAEDPAFDSCWWWVSQSWWSILWEGHWPMFWQNEELVSASCCPSQNWVGWVWGDAHIFSLQPSTQVVTLCCAGEHVKTCSNLLSGECWGAKGAGTWADDAV